MLRSFLASLMSLGLGYATAVVIINGPHIYNAHQMATLGAILATFLMFTLLISASLKRK